MNTQAGKRAASFSRFLCSGACSFGNTGPAPGVISSMDYFLGLWDSKMAGSVTGTCDVETFQKFALWNAANPNATDVGNLMSLSDKPWDLASSSMPR